MGVTNNEHEKQIMDYFYNKSNINIIINRNINWCDEDSIYNIISQFDVGISPLLPTEVNNSKSAFKLKQYMSCGVPVLASDTGENKNFLIENANGFICNSVEDYYDKIIFFKNINKLDYDKFISCSLNSLNHFDIKLYSDAMLNYYEKNFA